MLCRGLMPHTVLYTAFGWRQLARPNKLVSAAAVNGRPGRSSDLKIQNVPKSSDHEPYRIIRGKGKFFLDELDVLTLLDPPVSLTPLNSLTYNHGAYIWKKIGNIPKERRRRLLELMDEIHVENMWQVASNRYENPKLFVEDSWNMLPNPTVDVPLKPVYWQGRMIAASWPWRLLFKFKAAFFTISGDALYGRLIPDSLFGGIVSLFSSLYFRVKRPENIRVTNEECDLAFEFGNGQIHLQGALPSGFAKPVKLPWPFNNVIACIRPVGPGVLVGKLWDGKYQPHQVQTTPLSTFVLIQEY